MHLAARERLIIALDVPTAADANRAIERLADSAGVFKVGLQLFTAEGPSFVRDLHRSGHKIFLDLKLHDIPNTVASAVRSARELGVSMLTVHTAGGPAMLQAALEASGGDLVILGVTVLTSMDDRQLRATGVIGSVGDQVAGLAEMAVGAGCRGLVASPLEARWLRQRFGPEVTLVMPGVRPSGSPAGDQSRIATPSDAVRDGADYIVVGRPILGAADPAAAARSIIEELESVAVS